MSKNFTYRVESFTSVTNNLKQLLLKETFSDITLIVEDSGERLPGHSQVLASSSSVFARTIYGPFVEGTTKEVKVTGIDSQTFKSLLEFIYTGSVDLTIYNIVPLLEAAQKYLVDEAVREFVYAAKELIDQTDCSMNSMEQITRILVESYNLRIEEVQEMCLCYIDQNTEDFLNSEVFLQLPGEIVQLVLQRDTLYDGLTELRLYLACLKWARGSGSLDVEDSENFEVSVSESTLVELRRLLEHIRLPLIEAKYIIKLIEPYQLVDKDKLYLAMAYQAAPECFKEDTRSIFRERVGSMRPWCWDEEALGEHMILSADRRTVIGHHFNWEKALGSVQWHAGRHSFTVFLEMNVSATSNSWQIIVGVAHPTETSLEGHLGASLKEWGLACYSGHKISNGDSREEYTSCSKKGDRITVIVDFKTQTLEFLRNGASLGVAYKNIKPPVSPAVSLLSGQRVTLVFD